MPILINPLLFLTAFGEVDRAGLLVADDVGQGHFRGKFQMAPSERKLHMAPSSTDVTNAGELAAAGWRTEKGRDFVNPAQSLRIRLTSEVRKRNATPREAKIVPT